jgi:hypothetical protein
MGDCVRVEEGEQLGSGHVSWLPAPRLFWEASRQNPNWERRAKAFQLD